MHRSLGTRRWRTLFAAGLLLRPILIAPMAPGGPLGGSDLLPVALLAVFAGSALLAGGTYVAHRFAVALAIVTAIAGVPLAAIGAYVGLLMPWPLVLGVYNLGLAAVGIRTMQSLRIEVHG